MKFAFLIVFTLVAGIASRDRADAADVSAFELRGAEFKILSADEKQTIGTTRFTSSLSNSIEEIRGETTYLDGERDNEEEHLVVGDGRDAPRLHTYRHAFFDSAGSPLMVDTLDAETGIGSCARYTSGKMKVRESELTIPADSYAGASGLMVIVGRLRQGVRDIRFHEFVCAPAPSIFGVVASESDGTEQWPLYRGNLVRLDMQPDLGALNMLVAPFLPKVNAWFDPHDDWNYVGGEFDRYFRGPHVLTVRIAPKN